MLNSRTHVSHETETASAFTRIGNGMDLFEECGGINPYSTSDFVTPTNSLNPLSPHDISLGKFENDFLNCNDEDIYNFYLNKNPIASFKLAWMYENAIGGEKNIYKASYFYKLAASRGQYNAYLYLANLSLTDPNNINILLAASYSSLAKEKDVTGSNSLLNRLLPLLETHELDEMAILISSLESEIEKIKLINS